MRQTFDREMQEIQDDVLALGSMVENALIESVQILRDRDTDGAEQLIAQDHLINEKRFAIEGNCLALIATQQPLAGDLRTLAAVLEITTELERIGDYAKGIARISLMLGPGPLPQPLPLVQQMAEKSSHMLHRSLDAFIRRDELLARAIHSEDDEVDDLYLQTYRTLIAHIIADPQLIEPINYLLWVAHNLERAADRVTNICERVIFTVTGELSELDGSGG